MMNSKLWKIVKHRLFKKPIVTYYMYESDAIKDAQGDGLFNLPSFVHPVDATFDGQNFKINDKVIVVLKSARKS